MRSSNISYKAIDRNRSFFSTAAFIGLITALTSLTALAADTRPIQWIDLLPESEKTAYLRNQRKLIDIPPLPDLGALSAESDNSWLDRQPIGSHQAVSKHNNRQIELVGYPIPFSSRVQDSQTLTFLLVPELGAGLYLPAPPPNQTVRVNLPKDLAEARGRQPAPEKPVRITGLLRQATDSDLPYAYVIEATAWHW